MVQQGEQDKALARIGELAEEYVSWGKPTLRLSPVRHGSRLELDDVYRPPYRVSEIIQPLLNTAREYLVASGLLWQSHPGGTLLPRAYGALLRMTLAGASTAHWVLEPEDRVVRVARALTLRIEELGKKQGANEAVANSPYWQRRWTPQVNENYQQEIAESQSHLLTAKHAMWDLRGNGGTYSNGKVTELLKDYSATKAIAATAGVVFGTESLKAAGAVLVWNSMSADAHGATWAAISRARITGSADEALRQSGPRVTLTDYATAEELAPKWELVDTVYRAAVELWEARASAAR